MGIACDRFTITGRNGFSNRTQQFGSILVHYIERLLEEFSITVELFKQFPFVERLSHPIFPFPFRSPTKSLRIQARERSLQALSST